MKTIHVLGLFALAKSEYFYSPASETINLLENEDFVFDLGKKIDIRDLDQSKEILLFSAQDLFSLEPNYRDSEKNRIYPAITLNKSRYENPLDRERICLNLPGVDCYVSAQVLIPRISTKPLLFTLVVKVLDANDSLPEFILNLSSLELTFCRESLLRQDGINADFLRATDSDQGGLFYQFVEDSVPYLKLENSKNLRLSLDPSASYRTGLQTLFVEVNDSTRSTRAPIQLAIENSCTETFTFTKKEEPYRTVVEENVADFFLDIVIEHDANPEDVEVVFLDKNISDLLDIKAHNQIYLKKPLDFETSKKIQTTIALQLRGTSTILDLAQLVLEVKDINDNAPLIESFVLAPAVRDAEKNEILLEENNSRGLPVIFIKSSDEDTSSAGEINITITGDTDVFLFEQGFIWLKEMIDREAQNFFKIHVRACDEGKPKKCSEEVFQFTVLDKNDNEPFFTNCPEKVFEVEENDGSRKFLTTVRATDLDRLTGYISPFGVVEYKSDRPDILDVNNVTGQVFLNAALDREVTSFYSLPILAVDGGGRAARCNLRLRVNDQNDNSPNLDNLGDQISILEETQPGQVIIENIGGYDPDAGNFGKISYSLEDSFDGLFQIVDSSITVQKNIANITTGSAKYFNLEVIATDGGGLETRKSIRINVSAAKKFTSVAVISLIAGIIAGAVIVLLMFLSIIFILRRRGSTENKLHKGRNSEWASVEVPIVNRRGDSHLLVQTEAPTPSSQFHKSATPNFSALQHGLSAFRIGNISSDSDHVTDSGKGESEQESASYTDARFSPHNLASHNGHTLKSVLSKAQYGPRCVRECGIYGHSDTCWLSTITSQGLSQHLPDFIYISQSQLTQGQMIEKNGSYRDLSRFEVDLTPIYSPSEAEPGTECRQTPLGTAIDAPYSPENMQKVNRKMQRKTPSIEHYC